MAREGGANDFRIYKLRSAIFFVQEACQIRVANQGDVMLPSQAKPPRVQPGHPCHTQHGDIIQHGLEGKSLSPNQRSLDDSLIRVRLDSLLDAIEVFIYADVKLVARGKQPHSRD